MNTKKVISATKLLSVLLCFTIIFCGISVSAVGAGHAAIDKPLILDRLKDGEIKPLIDEWNIKGYLNDFPYSSVSLNSGISRGAFSYFVMNLIRTDPKVNPALREDIPADAWYKKSLEYLLHIGIMPAVNGKADPDGLITRQDAMKLLAVACELNLDTVSDTTVKTIQDYEDISESNRGSAVFAVEYGVIELADEKYFLPGMKFTYYDTFLSLETLRTLLSREPLLGTTYNNQLDDGTIGVRFYSELIEGIKSGKKLRFFDAKLRKCYNTAKKIVTQNITEDMQEHEKGQVLHDWLVSKSYYDTEALEAGPGESFYSPYGVLVEGKGGCESYARAYEILLSLCGVESMLVIGKADDVEHMWNIVKIDGDYYHVDATWDDPEPEIKNKASHYYFYVNDELMSQYHSWDKKAYPKCTTLKYNPYVLNNAQLSNIDSAGNYLRRAILNRETEISIRILGYDVDQLEQLVAIIGEISYSAGLKEYTCYSVKDCLELELKYY